MLMSSLLKRPSRDQPSPQTTQDATALDSPSLEEQSSATINVDKGFSVRSESLGAHLQRS